MLLSDKLKELMKRAGQGTNMAAASRLTEVPYTTLRDLYQGKAGKAELDTLRKLARTYDVPIEWLADDAADMSDPRIHPPTQRNGRAIITDPEAPHTAGGSAAAIIHALGDAETLRRTWGIGRRTEIAEMGYRIAKLKDLPADEMAVVLEWREQLLRDEENG